MKLKLLILFIILSFQIKAQEESAHTNQFGIEITNMNVFTSISGNQDLLEVNNSYLFGVGFNLLKPVNDEIDLTYGAGFRVIDYSEKDYSITFQSDFNPATFEANYFNSWIETSGLFSFVSGNVGLKWKTSSSENFLYAKPSLEALYFINTMNKSARVQESGFGFLDVSNPSLKVPNPFLVFVNASVGYQFPINDLDFFIEAKGSYSPQKLFKDENINNINLTLLGLVIGLQF